MAVSFTGALRVAETVSRITMCGWIASGLEPHNRAVRNVATDIRQMGSRASQGNVGQPVTGHRDAYKNLHCL